MPADPTLPVLGTAVLDRLKPCAECPAPTPPGAAYCSTRCRNAADRHDADDYLAEEYTDAEL